MYPGINRIAVLACAGVICLASTAVEAARPEAKLEVVPASTPQTFAIQAKHVRDSMRGNGRYSAISRADRNQVEEDIAKIEQLLEKHGSVENLPEHDWTVMLNAQEDVNALLTENDGDRLICRYEKKTGTHFREKYCITASEQTRQRNENQEAFRRLPSRVFLPPSQLPGVSGGSSSPR